MQQIRRRSSKLKKVSCTHIGEEFEAVSFCEVFGIGRRERARLSVTGDHTKERQVVCAVEGEGVRIRHSIPSLSQGRDDALDTLLLPSGSHSGWRTPSPRDTVTLSGVSRCGCHGTPSL